MFYNQFQDYTDKLQEFMPDELDYIFIQAYDAGDIEGCRAAILAMYRRWLEIS